MSRQSVLYPETEKVSEEKENKAKAAKKDVASLPGVMNNLSSKKLGQLLMLSLMCEPEGKQEWSERQEPQNETQRTKCQPLLTEDDRERLEQLGLGIAVDITEKHSWVKKSTFQAKKITMISELVAIDECNQSKEYQEIVENFSEVHGTLQSSFRPATPISLSIAADFHRSYKHSKEMAGKTVLTRTISFKVKDPITMQQEKETFETQLNEWLKRKDCLKPLSNADPKHQITEESKEAFKDKDGIWLCYTPATNHVCLDYLRALGSVTHYVSSVTLGASRYTVHNIKTVTKSASQSAGVSGTPYASAAVSSGIKKGLFKFSRNKETIGKVPDRNTFLSYRGTEEAVVRCSYSPLSYLVSHPHLRSELDSAVEEYIDSQVHGTRGPYFIVNLGTGKPRYWKIVIENQEGKSQEVHTIKCTSEEGEACNFYLKPHGKYFVIATDPEDDRSRPENRKDAKLPQRYVKLTPNGISLTAELFIDEKKSFYFKLRSPENKFSQSLQESRWLPEASGGSQPYFIQPKGEKPLHKKNKYFCAEEDGTKDGSVCVCVGNHTERNELCQLFILVPGYNT